jgi:SulP family sulfate permease
VLALALLFLIEARWPRIPGALVVMVLGIAASAAFDFHAKGIHVVGHIPAKLPSLSIPPWPSSDVFGDLIAGAFAVIIVAFAESFAAAKSYASKLGYEVDANQEMIGLGAANLGAGLSGGFAVDGSLSKTAAGVEAGQRSQMTSLLSAALVLITIVALTWMFEPLPEAVLGAIVIHAVWKLIDYRTFVVLWRTRRIDFALAIAAFLGVILIDILPGIVIGIVLSLVALIYRDSFTGGAELGRLEDEEGNKAFVSLEQNPDAETLPGVVLFRPPGSLIFSNAAAFSRQARQLLWSRTDPPASVLVVDCEEMADMDITGAQEMKALAEELRAADVELWLARLHGAAAETAEKAGVIDAVGSARLLPSIRAWRRAGGAGA